MSQAPPPPPLEPIPKWILALSGAALFGIFTFVGWWNDAANLDPSKNKKAKGPSRVVMGAPGREQIEDGEIDLKEVAQHVQPLMSKAEQAVRAGRYAEAQQYFVMALSNLERLVGPENPGIMVTCMQLARVCEAQQKFDEAEKYYVRALNVFENRPLDNEEEEAYQHVLETVCEFCYTSKQETKAKRFLHLWMESIERVQSPQARQSLPTIASLLGKIHFDAGEYAEAEQAILKGIRVMDSLEAAGNTGAQSPEDFNLNTIMYLSKIYTAQGRLEDSSKLYRDLEAKYRTLYGVQDFRYARIVANMIAPFSFDDGLYQDSLEYYDRVLESFEAIQNGTATNSVPATPARIALEVMEIKNQRAASLVELGRIHEAREVVQNLISNAAPGRNTPMTRSKYMRTTDATVVWDTTNSTQDDFVADKYLKIELTNAPTNKKIPDGAVVVARFENPEEGQDPIVVEAPFEDDKVSLCTPLIDQTKRGYYLVEVELYKDSSKAELLSHHFQMIQSILDSRRIHTRDDMMKEMFATQLNQVDE